MQDKHTLHDVVATRRYLYDGTGGSVDEGEKSEKRYIYSAVVLAALATY